MDTDAYPREDVKKLLGAMIVIKINPELSKENKKIADSFQANSFPRLIFLTPKGDVLEEIKGSPQPDGWEGSLTVDHWNAYVGAQNAKPQDMKGMAKNLSTLAMWYPETKYGKEALQIAEQNKGNAEFAAEWKARMDAHAFEQLVAKADAQFKLGKKKDAIESWKLIRSTYPGTPQAAEAEKQLKKAGVKLDPPAEEPKK
jgi:hypothetical protein